MSLPRTSAGISSRSFWFSYGITMSVMPTRYAARDFSLRPPMGSTLPRKVISPVMATERFTGFLVKAERMAVAMVMPAEGPSLGVAPSGTCTWMSVVSKTSSSMPYVSELERM